MKLNVITIYLIALATCTPLVAQNLSVQSRPTARAIGVVSERPTGLVDGANAVFRLSSPPDTNYPVAVFLNGLPYSTFRLENSKNLVFGAPPQPGDSIAIRYRPLNANTQGTKTRSLSSLVHDPQNTSEMLAATLLERELSLLATHRRELPEKPESLRMLDRSLSGSEQQEGGIDGLGDSPSVRLKDEQKSTPRSLVLMRETVKQTAKREAGAAHE